jgi:transcriptional regulator with XRE-family HTH domain
MNISIGEFVAERRKELRLTQQNLADDLGYTNQAISKFESGRSQMDVNSLPKLASLLSLSLDELIHGIDDKEGQPCSVTYHPEMVADNLVYLRKKKNLTQEKAAAGLGLSKRSLINYENNLSQPSLTVLAACCDFYKVKADDLVGQKLAPVAGGPARQAKKYKPLFLIGLSALLLLGLTGTGVYIGLKGRKTEVSSSEEANISSAVSSSALSSDSSLISSSPIVSSSDTVSSLQSSSSIASASYSAIGINSFSAYVNGSVTASLTPGTYSLSILINPSDWYTNEKYERIKWSVDSAKSSAPEGAEVQYISASYSWNLVVSDTAADQKIFCLSCYVMDEKGQTGAEAGNKINITFNNPGTSYTPSATDFLDDLKSFYPVINGYSEVYLPATADAEYQISFIFDPSGWDQTNKGQFEILSCEQSGSAFIEIYLNNKLYARFQNGIAAGDVKEIKFEVMNKHNGKISLGSKSLLIHAAAV